MSRKSIRTEIRGEAYTITPVALGWKVTQCRDRSAHSHLVFTDGVSGRPCRCSCPSFVHRGGCCKHMQAIIDLLPPTWTPDESEEW